MSLSRSQCSMFPQFTHLKMFTTSKLLSINFSSRSFVPPFPWTNNTNIHRGWLLREANDWLMRVFPEHLLNTQIFIFSVMAGPDSSPVPRINGPEPWPWRPGDTQAAPSLHCGKLRGARQTFLLEAKISKHFSEVLSGFLEVLTFAKQYVTHLHLRKASGAIGNKRKGPQRTWKYLVSA